MFHHITIFAVVNLTLIDLPGLTKVAVGNCLMPTKFNYFFSYVNSYFIMSILLNIHSFAEGQPESIVRDIEDMVRSYVEKVNKISLGLFSMQ